MVTEMLSQEEINALLGSVSMDNEINPQPGNSGDSLPILNADEVDALGEIGNISMGTAATTLSTLLGHKVLITTPKVEPVSWEQCLEILTEDLTVVSVNYTEGLVGSNLMILKDQDVKVITDLMMGGTGAYIDGSITELHFSAIAESMNQMIGSASTSMAQIFNKKIDISPPQAAKIGHNLESMFGPKGDLVRISFRLQIEDNIIDSELMHILPIHFAKELVSGLLVQETSVPTPITPQQVLRNTISPMPSVNTGYMAPNQMQQPYISQESSIKPDVDVKAPQFQSFESSPKAYPKENMNLLMDVSLEVSVELGRTSKKIKEILEFGPGSIIELNRLVGEPVDVLVNGKFVANGEVVVIDENFGIRITDIINPENRI